MLCDVCSFNSAVFSYTMYVSMFGVFMFFLFTVRCLTRRITYLLGVCFFFFRYYQNHFFTSGIFYSGLSVSQNALKGFFSRSRVLFHFQVLVCSNNVNGCPCQEFKYNFYEFPFFLYIKGVVKEFSLLWMLCCIVKW